MQSSAGLLTVTASNRDRLDPQSKLTQWFIKSIQWQTYNRFELLIADGGSKNYSKLKDFLENYGGSVPMRIVQHPIGEQFHRSLLNNVGVRNASTDYIMTTDVDMIFEKDFIQTLMRHVSPNVIVESRTLYLLHHVALKIYDGIIDPYTQWKECAVGRIKKRTTAGGCQCMNKDRWNDLHGFDEQYIGWGSEDQDLLLRVGRLGLRQIWMGESIEEIKLLHQPHERDLKKDLDAQEINKRLLVKVNDYRVNESGWGGKND
jgi:predicted glycosyltransferase involved in capsule biosynthesis